MSIPSSPSYTPLRIRLREKIAQAKAASSLTATISNPEPTQSGTDKHGNAISYNHEQSRAISTIASGQSCVVIGAAGTGKTTIQKAGWGSTPGPDAASPHHAAPSAPHPKTTVRDGDPAIRRHTEAPTKPGRWGYVNLDGTLGATDNEDEARQRGVQRTLYLDLRKAFDAPYALLAHDAAKAVASYTHPLGLDFALASSWQQVAALPHHAAQDMATNHGAATNALIEKHLRPKPTPSNLTEAVADLRDATVALTPEELRTLTDALTKPVRDDCAEAERLHSAGISAEECRAGLVKVAATAEVERLRVEAELEQVGGGWWVSLSTGERRHLHNATLAEALDASDEMAKAALIGLLAARKETREVGLSPVFAAPYYTDWRQLLCGLMAQLAADECCGAIQQSARYDAELRNAWNAAATAVNAVTKPGAAPMA